MTDTAYQILFRGFDCLVAPTEEGHFDVSLFEEGAHVYSTDIPIDLSQFETEAEIDENSNALIDEAAQAAVDEFEASRGSLGQGAGVGRQSMKKQAYWSSMDYADWYMTLKATSFKEQAESLLEQYFATTRDNCSGNQEQAQARRMAEQKLAQLEYELNILNLQRMKCAKPNETIIVIKAYRSAKEACSYTLEEFLDGFRGTKFEDQALAKMSEYLDVKKQIEAVYETSNSNYRAVEDLRQAMDELYVNALQQEVSEGVVDNSGIGIDSNMAADVMSLMEGVSLDTDLETVNEMPPALFANRVAQDGAYQDEPDRPMDDVLQDALAMVKSMKRSDPATIKNTIKTVYGLSDKDASDLVSYGKRAEKEDKENDGEYEVVELGQIHEGIDPAEVPLKDFPFAIGDKVTLSKAFLMPIWGGGTTELAKGTKGVIRNLYDGHGDAFMVCTEDGQTYCIPTEYLK